MSYATALPQGTQLKGPKNTYKIKKVLGQGTFGITYLATTDMKVTGQIGSFTTTVKVAVKEFFMKGFNGRKGTSVTSGSQAGYFSDYKQKFLREAENLSKLQHRNIVKVLESFETNGTVYYAMEYLEGGSLDDLIKRQGALSEPEAIRITRQIGEALSFMHAHQMLHLDLKPSNVMLREGGEAVLIDFGLSKQFNADGEPESDTSIGGGTPGYAPIEQNDYQRGDGLPVTMDVYALGASMFRMLTKQCPPEASQLLNKGFPSATLLQHHVSSSTIKAIRAAMAPMIWQRCRNVNAFLQLLDGYTPEVEVVDVVVPSSSQQKPKRSTLVNTSSDTVKTKTQGGWIGWGVGAMVVAALLFIAYPFLPGITASVPTKSFTANGVSFKMVIVEQDKSSFMIGQTEVTQALWKAVMGYNPSHFQGAKRPVENVSWNDCKTFIRKLNSITHQNFRLPTEEEWEYAARGGAKSKGYKYSGGNNLKKVSWYWANSGDAFLNGNKDWNKMQANNCRTHNVKGKKANELGIYDMSGNVWEWCEDVYERSKHVMRGGSWRNLKGCAISYRDGDLAKYADDCVGLRLAL